MTDNEIIKALECCVNNGRCKECPINPHYGNYGYCTKLALTHALELINRQKAEIERLKKDRGEIDKFARDICNERMLSGKAITDFEDLQKYIKKKKSEAIKEFAMKLIHFINDLNILPYTEGVVPCIKAKIKQIAEESEDES